MNIVNDKVTEYIAGLYTPLTPELGRLRKAGEDGHIPIILRDSERLLVTLVRMRRPKSILEIGTAIGYSASVFAEASGPDCDVTTIEVDPLYVQDAAANLCGLKNVTLIEGDAAVVMKDMETSTPAGKFDFVFIDGAKSHYKEFFDAALGLCKAGSIIVCDNVMMHGMTADDAYDERGRFETNIKYMRKFLDYISSSNAVVTSILPVGDGMSISVVI